MTFIMGVNSPLPMVHRLSAIVSNDILAKGLNIWQI